MRQLGHLADAGHQRLGVGFVGRSCERALGDVLGEIANAFKLGRDLKSPDMIWRRSTAIGWRRATMEDDLLHDLTLKEVDGFDRM